MCTVIVIQTPGKTYAKCLKYIRIPMHSVQLPKDCGSSPTNCCFSSLIGTVLLEVTEA